MMMAILLATAPISANAMPIAAQAASVAPSFQPTSSTRATILIRSPGAEQTIAIQGLDDTLAVLADQRLSAIWPQLLAWAGPGLESLRDRSVEEARAVFAKGRTKEAETGIASVVRPRLRPTFLLADALLQAGQIDQATQVMETARAAEPKGTAWWPIHWSAMSQWLAKVQDRQGHFDAALAILDAAIPPFGTNRVRLNLEASHASVLLELHRPAEALTTIDGVQAAFEAPGGDGPFVAYARIKGSDRQFAWVRACALRQLGRLPEAEAAAAPLRPAVEPQDKRFKIDPTVKLRKQLALCTHDVSATAQSYAEMLRAEPYGGKALLELQPGLWEPALPAGFMDQVRRHPSLAPILAERMRVLPDTLVPALNGWMRTPPGA